MVERAAQAGVRLLALTDHDTVEGIDEALAAAVASKIEVVPATEISTIEDSGDDLHLLGYRIDHRNERLNEVLALARADRDARARRIAAALRELGFELDETLIDARRAAGHTIGRPHLAQAATIHPANAERLTREGRTETSAFLEAYLIAGQPAFRPRAAPSVIGAIELIHGAGGLAIWAHPFWDREPDSEAEVLAMLERFAAAGLDGVEAFYITHTRAQVQLLHTHARELGLLITGSADFHGPSHTRFSRFRAFELYGLEPSLGAIAATR